LIRTMRSFLNGIFEATIAPQPVMGKIESSLRGLLTAPVERASG